MKQRYSIAEARQSLAAVVRNLERQPTIELTRRGEPVAVLLSLAEYRRLQARQGTFWDAYTAFRSALPAESGDLAALLQEARDPSPGRTVDV